MYGSSCSARKQRDIDPLCTVHLYIQSSGKVYACYCKGYYITQPQFWQWWGIRDRLGLPTVPFVGNTGAYQGLYTLCGLGNPKCLPDSSECAICSGMEQLTVGTVDDH